MEQVELVGASLKGPPPIGSLHLQMQPGLSILYGLNGAGKSTIIEALTSTLKGTRLDDSDTSVHLRVVGSVPDPASEEEAFAEIEEGTVGKLSALAAPLLEALRKRLEEAAHEYPDEERFRFMQPRSIRDALSYFVELDFHDSLTYDSRTFDEDFIQGVLGELRMSAHLCLSASGTEETPAWTLSPACLISDDTPNLQRVLDLQKTTDAYPILFDEEQLEDDVPHWVPIRFGLPAELSDKTPIPESLIAEEEELSADNATADVLDWWHPFVESLSETEVQWTPHFETLVLELSARASQIYAELLIDAPVLNCKIRHPEEWFNGRCVDWQALDRPTMTWVPIDSLSSAQKRWADFAIYSSLVDSRSVPANDFQMMVIDEPELALHSMAQRRLLDGLSRLARDRGWPIIVTSHSKEFLNANSITLRHVLRDDTGQTRVTTMSDPTTWDEAVLERMGLDRADLLQSVRRFVVVEGEHDALVIEEFLREELSASRSRIVRLRGVRNLLTLLDSQFLFDFTDANFLVVLDRIRLPLLSERWDEARRDFKENANLEGALNFLRPLQDSDLMEEKALYELLAKALQVGQPSRISLQGLKKADILDYVDVELLVPGAESWKALQKEYRRNQSSRPFKSWLKTEKGVSLSATAIRSAVGKMDSVPDDIVELGRALKSSNP